MILSKSKMKSTVNGFLTSLMILVSSFRFYAILGLCNGTKRFKPDPGLNGYQWTPPPSTYGTASTPVNFAASPMSSPSYCQTNSPLPPNSQRQRNVTLNQSDLMILWHFINMIL